MGKSTKTTAFSSATLGRVSGLFLDERSVLLVVDLETKKNHEEQGDVSQHEGSFSQRFFSNPNAKLDTKTCM